MKLLVGLTGGLASGKSTVAALLQGAGFAVVDADRLVAQLYRPGQPGAAAVRRLFGDRMIDPHGGVDHQQLADLVFADPSALHRLEAAIHPLVEQRFLEFAADRDGIIVIEGTLLVEAGFAAVLDFIVSIESDRSTQLSRAMSRGLGREAAEKRLTAQGTGEKRRAGADRIIDNSGSLDELRALVIDELVVELQALLSEGAE